MGGFLQSGTPLTTTEATLAGACSGLTSRAVISPLDVLKIRLQLQVQSPPLQKHHRSFVGAIRNIYKEEGLAAFWKGHIASQLLAICYTAVQFAVFERVSTTVWNALPRNYHTATCNSSVSFVSGSIAGTVASAATHPLDTVRTRMVMQRTDNKVYKHVFDAFVKVTRQEGMLGLWRGTLPNMLQVTPRAGIQFGAYSTLCRMVQSSEKVSAVQSFYCGALAGVVAKFLTLPLDLAKKRLEVQGFTDVMEQGGFGRVPAYKGLVDCLVTVHRNEGVGGFFKGATPSLIKAFVGTGLTFAAYNFYCGVLVVTREYR